jgi:hypothetical protein
MNNMNTMNAISFNKNKICRDFMENNCKRVECKFDHIANICYHYWKYKSCKFGDKCRLSHNYTNNISNGHNTNKPNNKRHIKNTESFDPLNKPVDMHLIVDDAEFVSSKKITSRDVVIVPNLFKSYTNGSIYSDLLYEILNTGIDNMQLFKLWHGNDKIEGTHLIADDKMNWKGK